MKLKTKLFSILIPVYLVPIFITGVIYIYENYIYFDNGLPIIVKILLHAVTMACALGASFYLTDKILSPLKEITKSMSKIAHGKLNERIRISTDDEFQELADTFNDMTQSLQKHTQTLATSLRELKDETDRANAATEILAQSAQYMDCASNETQHVIDDLVERKDFSIRFDNPDLTQNCWEVKKCQETGCPAHKNPNKRCWHTVGTFSGKETLSKCAQELKDCRKCEVYRKATPNRLSELGEAFNHVMNLLEAEKSRTIEMENAALNKKPDKPKTVAALDEFIENTSK